jgi:hypothetical protein
MIRRLRLMNKASLPAMVCIFILAIAGGVFAGPTQGERPYLEGKRFIGTVAATDSVTKTLVIKTWRRETVFDTSTARFVGHAGLEDMEQGERVLIRYIEKGGKKTARSVIKAALRYGDEKEAGLDAHIAKPADAYGK